MLTTLILEGNPEFRKNLQNIIQNRILINPTKSEYDMEISLIADDVSEMLEYIQKHHEKSFLLFVDTDKLSENLSIWKFLKDKLDFIEIVYLTNDDFIFREIVANKSEPLDIVQKKSSIEKFTQIIRENIDIAFSRYKINITHEHIDKFTYELDHGIFKRISLSQVYSIETITNNNKQVSLVCSSFKTTILGNLKNIETTHKNFFRCNRTTLVNIDNIYAIDKSNKFLTMNNGTVHKISTRKIKTALEIFKD